MINIIAKLMKPCFFIRYNPDHPESDLNILLENVQYYINLDVEHDTIPWDDFGFGDRYMEDSEVLPILV